MRWVRSWRADPAVAALADRHYSRKTPGAAQFSPPGRNLTLRTLDCKAGWVTSWPDPQYVLHPWGDAWTCTLFRNEGPGLSSELIVEACSATRARFGEPPPGGFLTFVDAKEVASRNPGYCFICAGFRRIGRTKDRGLLVLHLDVDAIPPPSPALDLQLALDGVAA